MVDHKILIISYNRDVKREGKRLAKEFGQENLCWSWETKHSGLPGKTAQGKMPVRSKGQKEEKS